MCIQLVDFCFYVNLNDQVTDENTACLLFHIFEINGFWVFLFCNLCLTEEL